MEQKQCGKCGLVKAIEEFSLNRQRGRQSYCKECQSAYFRENRERILPQIRAKRSERKVETRQWLYDYLSAHPCVDCGEADPVVLDFDHRDPAQKLFVVSQAPSRLKPSQKRLEAEVRKCDVRCANCHRRRTASVVGWYSDLNKPS